MTQVSQIVIVRNVLAVVSIPVFNFKITNFPQFLFSIFGLFVLYNLKHIFLFQKISFFNSGPGAIFTLQVGIVKFEPSWTEIYTTEAKVGIPSTTALQLLLRGGG